MRPRLVVALFALVTLAPTPAAAHPVDDGTSYRWVRPPHSRLTDNIAPEGRVFTIPSESLIREFWTPDAQFHLTWEKGGLGVGDVVLDAQPVDPELLSPLPSPHSANGNAYRFEMTPGRSVGGGMLLLKVPAPAVAVYHSRDGGQWRRLEDRGAEAGEAAVTVTEEGLFLAASDHPSHSALATWRGAGAAAVVAAALGWGWRHRRRRLAAELPRLRQ